MRKIFDGFLTGNTSSNPLKINVDSGKTISELTASVNNLSEDDDVTVYFMLGYPGFTCNTSQDHIGPVVPLGTVTRGDLLNGPYSEDAEGSLLFVWTSVDVICKLQIHVTPDDAIDITNPASS